jgi:hypothetical protein
MRSAISTFTRWLPDIRMLHWFSHSGSFSPVLLQEGSDSIINVSWPTSLCSYCKLWFPPHYVQFIWRCNTQMFSQRQRVEVKLPPIIHILSRVLYAPAAMFPSIPRILGQDCHYWQLKSFGDRGFSIWLTSTLYHYKNLSFSNDICYNDCLFGHYILCPASYLKHVVAETLLYLCPHLRACSVWSLSPD